MMNRTHALPMTRQAKTLALSRSTLYYVPKSLSEADDQLMKHLDKLHLAYPFAGARMLRDMLRQEGFSIGRKRVSRLMKLMGIEALYRKPRTTRKEKGHRHYPYLLRQLNITQANHVWAMDITYIPMRRGFVYLVAVVDWATRRVLAWRVSNTMDVHFCLEALEEALCLHPAPKILNTDQGSQFSSHAFTTYLKERGITLSMDGKGAWRDNVFVERLWRSVKYEDIYLHAYESVHEVKKGLNRYFCFYNHKRPHSSLDGKTPDQVYFNQPLQPVAA